MPSETIIQCSQAIKERGLSIAFVESVTAGRLASEFSLTESSGSILKGGIVCYDAQVKEHLLRINIDLLNTFTPESAEVTEGLARHLKILIPSDIQVAVTGLTTPGGSETPEKPVGTIFVHIIIKDKSIAAREVFTGTPEQIILLAADLAAGKIVDELTR